MNRRPTLGDARETSRQAFDPEPWRREIATFVRRMGARDADDVVQEAFLRACGSPPPSHPRAWLYRVALNVLRDRRRAERGSEEPRVPLSREPDPLESARDRELAALAWSAIERLPERQRAALWLRVQRHMDYDEVAVALGCSVATARQHFHLAVKAVRDRLADRERGGRR